MLAACKELFVYGLVCYAVTRAAIQLEGRDLENAIGEGANYRQSTPMLVPRLAPALPKTATTGQRG